MFENDTIRDQNGNIPTDTSKIQKSLCNTKITLHKGKKSKEK